MTADPRSARILKPWLRGRNVERWRVEWQNQYLVWAYKGIPIDDYPAVLEYLSCFQDRLANRWEPRHGQCEWYELRPCSYYDEFEKPKILYPDIASQCDFTFDEQGFYGGNTLYFIRVDDLALLGMLNSRVVEFFYRHVATMIQQDYLRFFTQYLEQVPIPTLAEVQREAIEVLVRKLLDAEGQGPRIDEWERELNALVYEVYGLTQEEIAIVERQTASDGGNT